MSAVYAIGNLHGRIAIHLDADEAEALAALYGPGDEAHYELLEAVRVAYPRREAAQPKHHSREAL